MIEEQVDKKELVKIKRYFHDVLSESTHLGVADKWLINRVVDQVYLENPGNGHDFLTLVEKELQKYRF